MYKKVSKLDPANMDCLQRLAGLYFQQGLTIEAKAQYTAFAEALRNPPPEFVGVNAKFVDTMSPEVGEDRKSYMTEKPDTGGASVWADVYLKGRTVLLVQVVDVSEDGQPLRTQAAERALSSAP